SGSSLCTYQCAPRPSLFPYTTLFRSQATADNSDSNGEVPTSASPSVDTRTFKERVRGYLYPGMSGSPQAMPLRTWLVVLLVVVSDRKSTRLNSSHVSISYAVFCLKKK